MAVATHLVAPRGSPLALLDELEVLLVGFPSTSGVLWAIGSIHLKAKLTFKDKMSIVQKIANTLKAVTPVGILLGGDFHNQLHRPRSVRATFVRNSKT